MGELKDFYSPAVLATAKKPPFLPKGHRFHIPGEERLYEASRKAPVLIDRDKLIEAIVNTPSLAAQEPTYDALSCQLRCADGTFQMWVASQSDILADDWYIVE